MAISRKRKEDLVQLYAKMISDSRAIYWTEYSGLSVSQMDELRTKIIEADGAFYVTKNTLMRHALREAGQEIPDDLLTGQLATGFALAEAPSVAKALVDYAKDEENVVLRGGLMDENILTIADIESLANMPSLDELRSQIIGLISAPARDIASVVASGVRQVVNVLDAYAKKEEETAEPA